VPDFPIRLFSPNNAAREIFKKDSQPDSMANTTCADRVSLTCCIRKCKRNNVPIVRANSGYNNPHNSIVTNQSSSQIIKAFISTENKLYDEHQHISSPSAIDEEMEEQPRLNKCNPEEKSL
jgi:hypothetical protein